MGSKSSGNRTDARYKGGRPPQSTTLRLGDGVAIRYGQGTPLELGEVTEIIRGIPRTVVIELQSGITVWLLAETPKE